MIHACIDDLGINYFDTANVSAWRRAPLRPAACQS
jgi:aryl-alcohol dehydrogenase-like predicted oxidoreductase